MFRRIQHAGYLVEDIDAAVAWFQKSFGATHGGGGPMAESYAVPSGGRNAYLRFGRAEAEIIEPNDKQALSSDLLAMHHVGYVVENIEQSMDAMSAKGFKFAADKPFTNVVGQQVLYLDASTTNGVLVHLTQLPAQPDADAMGEGLEIERIVHAGYRVKDLDKAVAWYVDNFEGVHIGGRTSGSAGRNAFVNFGQVQVELIEPADPSALSGDAHVTMKNGQLWFSYNPRHEGPLTHWHHDTFRVAWTNPIYDMPSKALVRFAVGNDGKVKRLETSFYDPITFDRIGDK